jgi:cytochrome P450
LREVLNVEILESMEYLGYVVKEALRYKPPGVRLLGYEAVEDVRLKCGVVIPRGTPVQFNIYGSHWNPNQWHTPNQFLPDRFNPDSPLFKTPNGEKRHPNTFCPFTFGLRACPGRALGMLEMKVLTVFVMTQLDWEIKNEGERVYSIKSLQELNMKAWKK